MAEGLEVSQSSLDALQKLSVAFREAEKPIQRRTSAALRKVATQLAKDVPRIGAEKMPKRGGLAERLANAKGGVSVALSGRNVSISIRSKSLEGYALRKIDQGIVRHPVFGEKRLKLSKDGKLGSAWVAQKVPAHAFTDAFEKESPEVKKAMAAAVQKALQDITREAT